MSLVYDDETPLEETAAAVESDPALATQVLRVANSAAVRSLGAEPMRDLRQALVMIGLDELRTMAGAMALLATFATRDELSLDLQRTSAVSASIAAVMAPHAPGVPRSLPFVCGLLCEVGALACLVVDGPGYVELWRHTMGSRGRWPVSTAMAREQLELKRYGVTARSVGARLLRRHSLPDDIARAVEATGQETGAPLVHRATAFARLVTPVIVNANAANDTANLADQLGEVARWTSLDTVGPAELVRRCLTAASNAERTVRAVRG
jgi:HD-like signal output (HDOD) protein